MTETTLPRELSAAELADAWWILSQDDRVQGFRLLAPDEAGEFFAGLGVKDQAELILALTPGERRVWLRTLAPDDAADLIQEAPEEARAELLALLDEPTRREVAALLAYAEDVAGGLMDPRFARLRAGMTVDEAIAYLRRQVREHVEFALLYYAYVLDDAQRLVGVLSFRELFAAPGDARVADVMHRDVVAVPEGMDQEAVARLFAEHDVIALPVVDEEGRMKGIVTVDDIVDVVEQEATEDFQKYGGMAALEEPYLRIGFRRMIRKRAGWLSALFLSEMLTASAMGRFEGEIARAVVLALFIPLIISSGGNSGSQASTLVIRAMALGEVRLRDWWRVARRELGAGLALGAILAAIGFLRIVLWQAFGVTDYGAHSLLLAAAVAASLVGVVLWGTLAGSMLPFLLRRVGLDPASASAPLVATLCDVTGIVIYFTVASVVLRGTLL